MRRKWRRRSGAVLAVALVLGAGAWVWASGRRTLHAPIWSPLLPMVVQTDRGPMRVEEEYLPGVVDCELSHFTHALPALEAQAIAARTYLARYLSERGAAAVVNTTARFQCWREPVHERSREAVRRTAGQTLRWNGKLINANYAAGAWGLDDDCAPPPPAVFGYLHGTWDDVGRAFKAGERFPKSAWTQIFVTYNRGKTGYAVRGTTLGHLGPPNRGALGQHAAICLAEKHGWDAPAILRFFYGEDVVIAL